VTTIHAQASAERFVEINVSMPVEFGPMIFSVVGRVCQGDVTIERITRVEVDTPNRSVIVKVGDFAAVFGVNAIECLKDHLGLEA